MQRDVAWGFFYGIVNFDAVVGTVNHYGNVDLYAGRFNEHYRKSKRDYSENFKTELIQRVFQAILEDWTNAPFDPFAAPQETGSAFGLGTGTLLSLVLSWLVVAFTIPAPAEPVPPFSELLRQADASAPRLIESAANVAAAQGLAR